MICVTAGAVILCDMVQWRRCRVGIFDKRLWQVCQPQTTANLPDSIHGESEAVNLTMGALVQVRYILSSRQDVSIRSLDPYLSLNAVS